MKRLMEMGLVAVVLLGGTVGWAGDPGDGALGDPGDGMDAWPGVQMAVAGDPGDGNESGIGVEAEVYVGILSNAGVLSNGRSPAASSRLMDFGEMEHAGVLEIWAELSTRIYLITN